MALAHQLALEGWGRAWPNPMVGAVIVRDRQVIGAGSHREYGGLHAERAALAAPASDPRDATMYVTLEPCSHTGQQPPCTEAILAAGIRRVIIAARDPNPVASGGADALRAAGVDVVIGDEALPRYNFRFQHRYGGAARPFVAVKLAVSLDGMIADSQGHSKWVSGPATRDWVHWLRAGFGAIAVGGRTATADDARLTVRGTVQPRVAPVRVVFDRSATLPASHPLWQAAADTPVIVVVGSAASDARRDVLAGHGARVVVADELDTALAALGQAGIDSILVEGGGRLAGALLRDGLVDRVYQVQSPRWLGAGVPAWQGLGTPALAETRRWRVLAATRIGEGPVDGDVIIEMEQ